MKLPAAVVDREVTFDEYQLLMEGAREEANHEVLYGEVAPEIQEYGYGAKHDLPVEAALTVLKLAEDPSWDDVLVSQSYLMGGIGSEEGVERAVERIEGLQREVPAQ